MDERAAFRTIGNGIKHRKYVLIAIVALITIGAGVASFVRPPTYQGEALLFIDQRFITSSQTIDLQGGELLTAHFIQEATSQPVLGRAVNAAAAQGYSYTPTTLGLHISAQTVRGTDWIGISATARSPLESADLANDVANALVAQNADDIHAQLAPNRSYIDAQLKQLSSDIAKEQAKIDALPAGTPPSTAAAEQAQLTLLQSQYSSNYTKSQDLQIEENRLVGSLTLAQQATAPPKPIDPDPLRYIAAGLVAGFLIGLVVVVLLDRFDDRIFESEALSQAAGTRLVVAVSHKESTSTSAGPGHAYTLARANLLAQYPHMRKLLVVAASHRDIVRPIAAGLGMAAVKAGQKVMVVDAEASAYVMQSQAGKNGSTMTIVSSPTNGEARFDEDPVDGDGKYQLTILSAPSPDSDPAAVTAARTADIAIVVATARATRYSDVRRTVETLRMTGIQVVASILADGIPERRPAEPEPEKPADLLEVAVNQWRLPTWRGPGGK
jgi:capsular polysaccharide biosynthesis protein